MDNKYIIGFDPYLDDNEKIVIFNNINEIMENRERVNNPKELEYWRNVFPNKTDEQLEEYRIKWSKENPKYLKFKNL